MERLLLIFLIAPSITNSTILCVRIHGSHIRIGCWWEQVVWICSAVVKTNTRLLLGEPFSLLWSKNGEGKKKDDRESVQESLEEMKAAAPKNVIGRTSLPFPTLQRRPGSHSVKSELESRIREEGKRARIFLLTFAWLPIGWQRFLFPCWLANHRMRRDGGGKEESKLKGANEGAALR